MSSFASVCTKKLLKKSGIVFYVSQECVKCHFAFAGKVDVSLTDSVQQLISLFRSLCITFGKPYSDKKVRIDYKKKKTH